VNILIVDIINSWPNKKSCQDQIEGSLPVEGVFIEHDKEAPKALNGDFLWVLSKFAFSTKKPVFPFQNEKAVFRCTHNF
jgi:hypothetical protein